MLQPMGRFSFQPPDPRKLPAPEGEQFRRRRRIPALLAQCQGLDRERYAEVLQEIMVHGVEALPDLRAASHAESGEPASLARAMVRLLVPDEIGAALAKGLARAEQAYPVELGAGILSRLGEPDLDPDRVLREIDKLAAKARTFISQTMREPLTPAVLASRTLDVLFRLGEFWKAEGFKGNTEDYYDPKNSWLTHVLEYRTGLPISLSILYIALSRRLGIQADGIGLPGHFITRVEVCTPDAKGYLFIDPFHNARPLDVEDCQQLAESHGSRFEPEEHLRPVHAREILIRMCNNLLAVHDHLDKHAESERIATVLTYLNPHDPTPRMIRAERRLRRGEHRQASEDLQQVLLLSPHGALAHVALKMLRQISYDHPF